MFPRDVAEAFEREMGCTEAEWLMWLPGAVGAQQLSLHPQAARVSIGAGALQLDWTVLPPRQIALARLPRLQVRFRFDALDAEQRRAFMRYFDLYMQRGGG